MDLVGLICLHGVVKVLLTSPTTPTDRMKAIVEAAGLGDCEVVDNESLVLKYESSHLFHGVMFALTGLVSSVGVTCARASVSDQISPLYKSNTQIVLERVKVQRESIW
uniref:Uncharacterized protein n=1 Tax=Quercus lobata TaxID=97700 RepID=A0A7N2QWW8_QUELO